MPALQVLERGEAGYPERLHDLADPPGTLYVLGAIPEGPAVAIVGARAADRQGLRIAGELAGDLARSGVTVVSGGARGIDQAAHRGALDGGGSTIIVLGCGIEVEYPKGSSELRDQVARSGAVVSELLPSAKPRPAHFPKRNRIVAALVDAVVVVQAGERSGALVTARLAGKLSRPVLAVPGIPNAPLTRGTHGLLRSGAGVLVENGNDLLQAIGIEPSAAPTRKAARQRTNLSRRQTAVASWLDAGPASADELARGLEQPVNEILATLVDLELEGVVVNEGGCYEIR